MSKTATQTVEETGLPESSRRSSKVPALFSRDGTWFGKPSTPMSAESKKLELWGGKYFQPESHILATASEKDLITVPVHEAHIPRRRKRSVIDRLNDRMMPGLGPNEEFRLLRMSKGEYTKYWAYDDEGNYVGTEPEGEGQERMKAQGW